MTIEKCRECRPEHVCSQSLVNPQAQRHVVGSALGVQPVQQPESFLSAGQGETIVQYLPAKPFNPQIRNRHAVQLFVLSCK